MQRLGWITMFSLLWVWYNTLNKVKSLKLCAENYYTIQCIIWILLSLCISLSNACFLKGEKDDLTTKIISEIFTKHHKRNCLPSDRQYLKQFVYTVLVVFCSTPRTVRPASYWLCQCTLCILQSFVQNLIKPVWIFWKQNYV